jgi:hypothetical protein
MKVNIQNIKVDLARSSNGRYESTARRDDTTNDCPIFDLDIIFIDMFGAFVILYLDGDGELRIEILEASRRTKSENREKSKIETLVQHRT